MISNIVKPDETPDNWEFKQLSNFVSMKGGTNADQNEEKTGFPVTRIETISNGDINPESVNHIDVGKDSDVYQKHIMEEGDILFSNINSPEHVGKTALYDGVPDKLLHGMNLILIRPNKNKINPIYLERCFQWLREEGIFKNMCKNAINQASLAQKDIKPIELPIPPLNEQERIVEAVEERLERMQRLTKSVENVGRHTKEYRESLIEYLFVGRRDFSTQSPKQIPTKKDVPESWEIKTIGEISSQIRTGGTPKKSRSDFWGGNIPWKASKHFNEDSILLNESSEYVTEKGKSESTMANPDDVVIVCRGAHTGKVGLVQSKFLFNQDVKVIRLPESINSEFVTHYLSNHTEYFLQKQRGGTTKGITTNHVKNLRIPVPPVKRQREIVNEVNSIEFSEISKAVSDVDTLFNEYRSSVLAHAFKGQIEY